MNEFLFYASKLLVETIDSKYSRLEKLDMKTILNIVVSLTQVWDLADEEVQEEIADSPESWIQDKIQDHTVRVILGRKKLVISIPNTEFSHFSLAMLDSVTQLSGILPTQFEKT